MQTKIATWWAGLLLAMAMVATPVLAESGPVVKVETSLGEILVELNPDRAPISVDNFLKYVDAGFYNGTIFHRVIEGFMIQGGGYTSSLKSKKAYAAIELESRNGLKNEKYTVSMARTPDPNSATSQFFINVVDNPRLDYPDPDGHGYAVFGRVVAGFETVDKITGVKTLTRGGMADVPSDTVLIREIVRQGGESRTKD